MVGGIGGLVLVGMVGALGIGLHAAQVNTLELARERTRTELRGIDIAIHRQLDPAANHVRAIAQIFSEPEDIHLDETVAVLLPTMKTVPQILASRITMEHGDWYHARRDGLTKSGTEGETAEQEALHGELKTSDRVTWSDPVFDPFADHFVIIARQPVLRNETYQGHVESEVGTSAISTHLNSVEIEGGGAFLVYGGDQLIGHSDLNKAEIAKFASVGKPLTKISKIADEVMLAFLRGEGEEVTLPKAYGDITERRFQIEDEDIVLLYQTVDDIGDEPWIIGAYVNPALTSAGRSLRRLEIATGLGAVLLAAILMLIHRLTLVVRRPVTALAEVSEAVHRLDFSSQGAAASSKIRELDDAARATNKLVSGLRLFETYVPKNLVQTLMLLEDSDATVTTSRDATVLFSDIVGFTGLSEAMAPEVVVTLLNHHFTIFNTEIEAEAGTLDKYIGDAVMAFWNAPVSQADHAARACRVALRVGEAISSDNRERNERGEPSIRVRIGLHTGPVVAGNIGAPGRLNYTIVGDTVNTANRIEGAGKELVPDAEVCVLASKALVDAAGPGFEFKPLGQQHMSGRAEAIEVFQLVSQDRSIRRLSAEGR